MAHIEIIKIAMYINIWSSTKTKIYLKQKWKTPSRGTTRGKLGAFLRLAVGLLNLFRTGNETC